MILLVVSVNGVAGDVPPEFNNEENRHRYYNMIEEIRCLVCQNQNLADSNADLAQDLRHIILEKILAGQSDEEIVHFLTQRYGDFVLYRPPVRNDTLVLWLGPFIFLVLGLIVLIRAIAKRKVRSDDLPIADHEQEKIAAILRDDKSGK